MKNEEKCNRISKVKSDYIYAMCDFKIATE